MQFADSLTQKLQDAEGATQVVFNDLDISQNKIPYEAWEAIFFALDRPGVKVERLRIFGCVTADDHVMGLLANWIGNLTADVAPTELHLSDCAFTAEGWRGFVEAFEQNEAFPTVDSRSGKTRPLYVRIENNYVETGAIQEKIDDGTVITFEKGGLMHKTGEGSAAKIKIMVRGDARGANPYQQKSGGPPAPDQAPPPKPVHDRYSQQTGQTPMYQDRFGAQAAQQHAHMQRSQQMHAQQMHAQQMHAQQVQMAQANAQWARHGSAPPQQYPQHQYPQHQYPAAHAAMRPAPATHHNGAGAAYRPSPAYGAVGPGAANGGRPHAQPTPQATQAYLRVGKPAYVPVPRAAETQQVAPQPRGSVGRAQQAPGPVRGSAARPGNASQADRSRTPPPKAAKTAMPGAWEEHWSDDYQIPYYWNKDTGDSMWDKPTKP